jgi:hypothetical protein
MITRGEVIDLLKLSALYDQRTAGTEDLQGWLLVAQYARWTKPAAQRVIVEHYAQGGDRPRITPALITDGIRTARRLAAGSFEAPIIPDPPPLNYPGWYRQKLTEHVERVVADWADGHPIPIATPRHPGEVNPRVAAAIESVASTTRIPGDPR